MNRYQCPNCMKCQYSSSDRKTNELCIYCGHPGVKLMKDISETKIFTGEVQKLERKVFQMDDRVGTCPECGGWLIYIHALNEIVCDTCDYEEEGVN